MRQRLNPSLWSLGVLLIGYAALFLLVASLGVYLSMKVAG